MKVVSRLAATAAAAGLGLFGVLAPGIAHASTTVVTVGDTNGYEYVKGCDTTSPYACYTHSGTMVFLINASNTPGGSAISVSWQLVAGTATQGVDYLGPYTGTVSVTPGFPADVVVPLVNDGVTEPAETFTLKLTSASVPADLTSVGHATINDGGRVPVDCNFSRTATSAATACTNRPANQNWQTTAECKNPRLHWPANLEYPVGNVVTGNGTSTVNCDTGFSLDYQDWQTV